ncbi:acetyl-CoA synthetase [Conglomerata obtusa]
MTSYSDLYKQSITDRETFYKQQAEKLLTWHTPFEKVVEEDFDECRFAWFTGGRLNACYNALDRHINATCNVGTNELDKTNNEKLALVYDGNDGEHAQFTYRHLLNRVLIVTNALKNHGLTTHDCITVYMPVVPATFFAALACARLGIVHNFVFGGFSPSSLAWRIKDSRSKAVITVGKVRRGDGEIDFLENVKIAAGEVDYNLKVFLFDEEMNFSIDECDQIGKIDNHKNSTCCDAIRYESNYEDEKENLHENNDKLLTKNTDRKENINKKCFDENKKTNKSLTIIRIGIDGDSSFIPCVPVESEHPLFYMYTSGSTGKPKGVVHTTAGYLLNTLLTTKHAFKFDKSDAFFCTADMGWLAAGSHSLYGPLGLGGTTVVFGGTPIFPDHFRLFKIIDKYNVTHLYTAPTVIRMLQRHFKTNQYSLDNIRMSYPMKYLRILGSVGEPLNREAFQWYKTFFNGLPIIDTYWQTESGAVMICPNLEYKEKALSAGMPFFGMQPLIVKELDGYTEILNTIDKNSVNYISIGKLSNEIYKNIININKCNETLNDKTNVRDINNNKDSNNINNKDSNNNDININNNNNNIDNNKDSINNNSNINNNISNINSNNNSNNSSINTNSANNNIITAFDGRQFVVCEANEPGTLIFKGQWPSIIRDILNDNERYKDSYWKHFKSYYHTGDEAVKDNDGYIYILGRFDDVLNVSGHRLSTAQIENVVCEVKGVSEAAVVPADDEITGQAIVIYVVRDDTRNSDTKSSELGNSIAVNKYADAKNKELSNTELVDNIICNTKISRTENFYDSTDNLSFTDDELKLKIKNDLRNKIGRIVNPKEIYIVEDLPKTRTGKIMRRVLKGILNKKDYGDISACANVEIIGKIKSY